MASQSLNNNLKNRNNHSRDHKDNTNNFLSKLKKIDLILKDNKININNNFIDI